jgi:glycosyltransferase involved in cell wall biosynthesis
VTTDVGDAAAIVGETGLIVPRRDSQALSRAWLELAQRSAEERATLGTLARRRIEERYGIAVVAAQYEALYRRLLDDAAEARRCAASAV